MQTKKCCICNKEKQFYHFFRHAGYRDGYDTACKSCRAQRKREILVGDRPSRKQKRDTIVELLDKGLKKCTKCKSIKSLGDFPESATHITGRHPFCKSCFSEYMAERTNTIRLKNAERPIPDTKTCSRCHKTKSSDEFTRNYVMGDCLAKECKTCRHEAGKIKGRLRSESNKKSALARKYGMTIEQYEGLEKSQNHVCAICGNPETSRDSHTGKTRRLAVDHNHITARVRGLLCQECNHGIGNFKDNRDLLRKAIAYLDFYEPNESVNEQE